MTATEVLTRIRRLAQDVLDQEAAGVQNTVTCGALARGVQALDALLAVGEAPARWSALREAVARHEAGHRALEGSVQAWGGVPVADVEINGDLESEEAG